MPKPVTEPRIVKLIELEASGRIKPEHQAELDSYRARGLAPKGNEAGSEQGKAGGFYRRAIGANTDFANAKAPTPGLAQSVGAAVLPADVMNGLVGEDRQLADQAQRDFIAATLRYESGAAIPPEEFESQRRIFFPVPGDGPKVIAQKSAARLRAIEGLKDAAGPAARGIDAGGAAKPAEQIAVSKDGSGTFATEADKSFAQIAQAAFDKGANRAQLDALAVQYGYQRYNDDLDKAIAYRNSGKKGAIIAAPESGSKGPTILGTLAATPVGSGFAGAANSLTGGYLDEIVGATGGDAEHAQAAKEVMRANNPIAYGAGEIGGAVLGSLGGGAAAARLAPSLGAGATSLIGDAAYGAIYGSGEQNDNRLGGALVGAGSAAAGGLVGQGLVRGGSRILSPNVAPGVRFLRDRGVRTTPGQSLGETASRFEEKLVSLPVVGDLIRSGRERALGDFNRSVMNDALSRVGAEIPEGVEGTAAMQMGQEAFDKAYDAARSNMSLTPDQQLADELADLSERVASGELSDASANRLATIYEAEISRRLRGGAVDGSTYKRMSSRLGALQRSTRGSDPELSNALGEMQSIIDQAARRSSPPEAAAAMDAADEGYALWARVENAARMRGGDTGKFTPSQLDVAVQRGDGSVRSRSYLRGDALGQEWAEAGKAILRDQVPNSGTADRLAAGGVLGGIAYAEPTAAIPMVALAGAYAPGVRDALSGAFAGARPEGVLTVAEALRRGIPVANALGSGAALASLPR